MTLTTTRIIPGEQAVMENLVEIVEELYLRTYHIVGQDDMIISKLKKCKEILGMEEEE